MSNHVKCPACYMLVNEMDLVDEPPTVNCPSCDHGMPACDWQVNVFWMPDDYTPRRVFAKRRDARKSGRVALVQRLLFE